MPELKKAIKQIVVGIGMIASVLTIKNELNLPETEAARRAREAEIAAKLKEAAEIAKQATDAKTASNLNNKLHLNSISNINNRINIIEEEESDLRKALKEHKNQIT